MPGLEVRSPNCPASETLPQSLPPLKVALSRRLATYRETQAPCYPQGEIRANGNAKHILGVLFR
ncbi:MAG: hypothetical protein AAFX78_11335 [Cyanobacteria bacterium J06638_20]